MLEDAAGQGHDASTVGTIDTPVVHTTIKGICSGKFSIYARTVVSDTTPDRQYPRLVNCCCSGPMSSHGLLCFLMSCMLLTDMPADIHTALYSLPTWCVGTITANAGRTCTCSDPANGFHDNVGALRLLPCGCGYHIDNVRQQVVLEHKPTWRRGKAAVAALSWHWLWQQLPVSACTACWLCSSCYHGTSDCLQSLNLTITTAHIYHVTLNAVAETQQNASHSRHGTCSCMLPTAMLHRATHPVHIVAQQSH